MDLNAARMFVYVVSKGSFSAAAKAMEMPVATVSRRIAELEKDLNIRLLERSTRMLRLTGEGSTLYEYVARGIDEFDAGLLALTEQQHELRGALRFSMPPSFEPMWTLLNRFQQDYSNVELSVAVTERRIDFIADGIDVALRIGDLQTQSAVARNLLSYRHKLVATPAFIEKFSLQTPDDLLNVPCVAWGKSGQTVEWNLAGKKISLTPIIRVNDYLHIRSAVLFGQVISEMPPFLCDELIEKGELMEVLPNFPLQLQAVSLVYPSRKNVSRITRAFIDFCVAGKMWNKW